MRKILATVFFITFGIFLAGSVSASLYSFWQERGQPFIPCNQERATLAAEFAVWDYDCSAEKNDLLEKRLRDFYSTKTVDGEELLGFSVITGYRSTLSLPMTATQNTVPVASMLTKDGTTITMDLLGDRVFLTLEPGTSKEEITMCTGISGNSFTDCTRGLAFSGTSYNTVTANRKTHNPGSIVVMSNVHYVYDEKLDVRGNDLVFGDGTSSTSKYIYFNDGTSTSTYPAIRWNASGNQLEFRRSGDDEYRVMPTQLRGTYDDYASLPSTGNSVGDIAITTDDSKLYTWDGVSTWVLAGGSSGAGTVYKTEKLGSESDGGDLKTFSLTAGSWPNEKFLLVYKNGQLQRIGASYDYEEVDSDTIEFTYELASDDLVSMIVVSVDLYNPAWGVVNDNIIPDTNNAYDIGSSSLQFKDLYLKGDLILNDVPATSTPTADAIPIASSSSKLDNTWLNASTTATANQIPIANSSGIISNSWISGVATTTALYSTSTAAAGNYDVVADCGFTPSNLQVNYIIRGKKGADISNTTAGMAYYRGTTLLTAFNMVENANTGGSAYYVPTFNSSAPVVGDTSGSYQQITMSIASIVNNLVTVRFARLESAGTARVQEFNLVCYK